MSNHPATTEIYTLSLHDALPICGRMSIQVDIVVDHVTSDDEVDHGHVRLLGSFLNAGPRSEYRSNRLRRATGQVGACCPARSEEHTSELQSHSDLVCRLLLEKKK